MATNPSRVIVPKITSITPDHGPAGTEVTIKGSGFVDGNNIWGVFFNGVPTHDWTDANGDTIIVGWRVEDDSTIIAQVPEGYQGAPPLSGEVSVIVRTEGGRDNFGQGAVDSNDIAFTYE